jgi:hypothetical protein
MRIIIVSEICMLICWRHLAHRFPIILVAKSSQAAPVGLLFCKIGRGFQIKANFQKGNLQDWNKSEGQPNKYPDQPSEKGDKKNNTSETMN